MDKHTALPTDLRPYRSQVEPYVVAKLRQLGVELGQRLNPGLTKGQIESIVEETLRNMAKQEQLEGSMRVLRLVLRHDCQSSGCGDAGCLLCQNNPSRLCKRNLKVKYLIDDHLRAKCGSPLRVELVDDHGACFIEGLPTGIQLEIHVLNGEQYKEICPDNTLLSHEQLKKCVISHHQKALLKRENGSDDQLRCFLTLERGQAPLSDLSVTTSSEALLAGKAPTFRLLVWAVDSVGEPVPSVTYVVSESFVVATKRVKHAIKSDIPSIADHVSKLVHIGKATVEKLNDIRAAGSEDGFKIQVPDHLNTIDKVGQFRQLVELCERNSELKGHVRHILKLSPEKWEEVIQHVMQAVVPDFRPRVWWNYENGVGLMFACKNGTVSMEHPVAMVKMGKNGQEDAVVPIHTLEPQLFNSLPKLKACAVQSWYAPSHPGWVIHSPPEEVVDRFRPFDAAAAAVNAPGGPHSGFRMEKPPNLSPFAEVKQVAPQPTHGAVGHVMPTVNESDIIYTDGATKADATTVPQLAAAPHLMPAQGPSVLAGGMDKGLSLDMPSFSKDISLDCRAMDMLDRGSSLYKLPSSLEGAEFTEDRSLGLPAGKGHTLESDAQPDKLPPSSDRDGNPDSPTRKKARVQVQEREQDMLMQGRDMKMEREIEEHRSFPPSLRKDDPVASRLAHAVVGNGLPSGFKTTDRLPLGGLNNSSPFANSNTESIVRSFPNQQSHEKQTGQPDAHPEQHQATPQVNESDIMYADGATKAAATTMPQLAAAPHLMPAQGPSVLAGGIDKGLSLELPSFSKDISLDCRAMDMLDRGFSLYKLPSSLEGAEFTEDRSLELPAGKGHTLESGAMPYAAAAVAEEAAPENMQPGRAGT